MNVHQVLGSITSSMLAYVIVGVIITNFMGSPIIDIGISRVNIPLEIFKPEPFEVSIEKPIVSLQVDQQDLECMATNMYFEARNQNTDEAMAAVGYIVLNRVVSSSYKDSVCEVVYQGRKRLGQYVRNKCQFSWVCNGKPNEVNPHNIVEERAWQRVQDIAYRVLSRTIDNPVGNATMYHATYVEPDWADSYDTVAHIEDHIFYEKRI